MPLRIAVGGFLHESHSFAPRPTTWPDFFERDGIPGFCYPDTLIERTTGCANAIAGALAALAEAGAEAVPLAWAAAPPAGPVEDEAFERISAILCAALSAALEAGPLDGIFLDLHGAALAVSFPDAEGELLRRVGAIAPGAPVTASLDPHCNLTEAMVARADALVPYRTYPHVDMREAGAHAAALLLARIARGRPFARAFRQVPFWPPLNSQCTMIEPMASVMAERARIATETGVHELGFCFGFPYADFPDCGAAIGVYADTEAAASTAAARMLDLLVAREQQFRLDVVPAREAVAAAIAASPGGLVVIADTQDNPGGGGHGDTTGLLRELIDQNATATLCLINDAESAAACHAAGEGAGIALSLGGKSDGCPIAVQGRVEKLGDGRFALTGPMGSGNVAALGPMALLAIGSVRVVIASRKMQALDQAILRHLGVEPRGCGVLALKSSVHFRADFTPIASRIIVALAPGPVVADPATLPFKNVRADVRKRPMANSAA